MSHLAGSPHPPPSQPGEVWAGADEDAAKPVTESAGPVAQGTVFANEILQEELAAQERPCQTHSRVQRQCNLCGEALGASQAVPLVLSCLPGASGVFAQTFSTFC